MKVFNELYKNFSLQFASHFVLKCLNSVVDNVPRMNEIGPKELVCLLMMGLLSKTL